MSTSVYSLSEWQGHLLSCPGQLKTLPKAQRTRGLSSYYKLLHKSWSNYIFRISNRYHFQNLNQTWTSQLKLNFQILTKPSFKISTKIQIHNLYKTSAAKYQPNFSFKILAELNFKSLPNLLLKIWTKGYLYDQTSATKSATNCSQHDPYHQHQQL